jgi:hypothetical protein
MRALTLLIGWLMKELQLNAGGWMCNRHSGRVLDPSFSSRPPTCSCFLGRFGPATSLSLSLHVSVSAQPTTFCNTPAVRSYRVAVAAVVCLSRFLSFFFTWAEWKLWQ